MGRIKRIVSIYDFPDYPEFHKTYDDSYPSWYTVSIMDAAQRRICAQCGKPLPATAKPPLCSEYCKIFYRWATHDQKVNSLRRIMHKHNKFQCQGCGAHLSYFTPAGVELPIFIGEVDHIVPLKNGGKDLISNLQLLCEKCHDKKTDDQYDRA